MKMYVANCTQQVQDFTYKVLEAASPRRQSIPIGGQVVLSGDFNQRDVDYVVEQHAKFGMVRVDEIDGAKPFVGLCYDVDRPVPSKKIQFAVVHNMDVLTERGKKIREESAVALNNFAENQLRDSGLPGGVKETEVVAIEQETHSNRNPTFAEGVRVNRGAEPPRNGKRRRA